MLPSELDRRVRSDSAYDHTKQYGLRATVCYSNDTYDYFIANVYPAINALVGTNNWLDLKTMDLTVSGIYDNHVENYAIIVPQTMEEQLDEEVPMQMAFVNGLDTIDIRDLTGQITVMSDVMNVAVSQDFADMVSTMMEAMDLVVIVVEYEILVILVVALQRQLLAASAVEFLYDYASRS